MFTQMFYILTAWAAIKALRALIERRSPAVSLAFMLTFLAGAWFV